MQRYPSPRSAVAAASLAAGLLAYAALAACSPAASAPEDPLASDWIGLDSSRAGTFTNVAIVTTMTGLYAGVSSEALWEGATTVTSRGAEPGPGPSRRLCAVVERDSDAEVRYSRVVGLLVSDETEFVLRGSVDTSRSVSDFLDFPVWDACRIDYHFDGRDLIADRIEGGAAR